MPVACSPNRGWDWCVPEYEKKKKEKKEIDPMFIEEL